jgi:hypothetical protein
MQRTLEFCASLQANLRSRLLMQPVLMSCLIIMLHISCSYWLTAHYTNAPCYQSPAQPCPKNHQLMTLYSVGHPVDHAATCQPIATSIITSKHARQQLRNVHRTLHVAVSSMHRTSALLGPASNHHSNLPLTLQVDSPYCLRKCALGWQHELHPSQVPNQTEWQACSRQSLTC